MNEQSFPNGTLVQIWNREHIWHHEIAIVRDQQPGFHRIEFSGSQKWIPTHWLVGIDNERNSSN